jgi:16S rRNA (cytidine1402-2'-O)-methyltransferase
MSLHYATALAAAADAAGAQSFPAATLYVVATPIGNLADVSLRALHVLQLADAIACEDTRHTLSLLRAYGIDGKPLIAAHQHNEEEAATRLIERLRAGERVALVSDAGTPAVSDPGARLVARVHEAGLGVVPIAGASSVAVALSAAGAWESLGQDAVGAGGYVFAGFCRDLGDAVKALQTEPAWQRAPVVFFEAPHRIEKLARAFAPLGERRVTLARELTKAHEQFIGCAAHELPERLAADANAQRGEFVVVVHAAPVAASTQPERASLGLDELLTPLLKEVPLKTAVGIAVQLTGWPKSRIYDRALQLKATLEV